MVNSIKEFMRKVLPKRFFLFCARSYYVPFNSYRVLTTNRWFQAVRKGYYQPMPLAEDLSEDFFSATSDMVGVDLRLDAAVETAEELLPPYLSEFREIIPDGPDSGAPFDLLNGRFMAVDAHLYYAFIRHYKPQRIVEVGGGSSSIIAGIACEKNHQIIGEKPFLTIIEPFPAQLVKTGFPGLGRLIEAKVQDVPLDEFALLEAGDILFIDSTHVLRSGGDVQYEYLEILPRLAPGVLIHIHDISLPKAYPRCYMENDWFWNEQYLLQAFLSYNHKFEVLWPGNCLMLKYPTLMHQVFPEIRTMQAHYPESEPSSFWIRVKL